jgi:secreted PhoX family phosphatase
MNRRAFVKGLSAAALLPSLHEPLALLARAQGPAAPATLGAFEPIAPTDADDLVLPEGFRYDVVLKWGDPFTASGETFGYNNDFVGVFPLKDDEEALLVVNHEYISLAYLGDAALYPATFEMLRGRAPTVDDYKLDVGSRRRASGATVPPGPGCPCSRTRSTAGSTPVHRAAWTAPPRRSSGRAWWRGRSTTAPGRRRRGPPPFPARRTSRTGCRMRWTCGPVHARRPLRPSGGHYGWVVEVDPYDPASTPVKHTALGRFRHENVGLRVEPGAPVVGYMGDDRPGGHVWKFVSDEAYRPGDAATNRRLLASGRLYAARFNSRGRGEWRLLDVSTPLDPNPSPRDPKPAIPRGARRLGDVYFTQGAVLMDAYQAANAIGASPSGRPEELEVHPADGSVFIAFTASSGRPGLWENAFGQVWRIRENRNDPRATRFRWERFAVGGPADASRAGRVFVAPDNLLFDRRGDLWLATDIASAQVNEEEYRSFKNSGLFHLPVNGSRPTVVQQFASMPCESEPTGPAFAPGEQALFLSVQHPGERHGVRVEPGQSPRGSNWPHRRPGAPPQPAVVAIRRS